MGSLVFGVDDGVCVGFLDDGEVVRWVVGVWMLSELLVGDEAEVETRNIVACILLLHDYLILHDILLGD